MTNKIIQEDEAAIRELDGRLKVLVLDVCDQIGAHPVSAASLVIQLVAKQLAYIDLQATAAFLHATADEVAANYEEQAFRARVLKLAELQRLAIDLEAA